MADDPKLIVILEARLDKFEKQLSQAGVIADRHIGGIMTKFERAGFTGPLLKAAAAAFTLDKAIESVFKTLESAAKTHDVAERVGISAEALQEIQFALLKTGGDAEVASSGLQKFAENLSKAATGGGELARLFKFNNLKVSDDVMTNLLNVANLIKNARTEADQLFIAEMAFGRGAGREFVNALKGGSQGLIDLAQQGRDAGAIIRNDLIKTGSDLETQWKELVITATKLGQTFVLRALPQIQAFLNRVEEWATTVLPILQKINEFNPVSWVFDKAAEMAKPGEGIAGGPAATGSGTRITVSARGTVIPPAIGSDQLDALERAIALAKKHTEEVLAETEAIDLGAEAQARAKLVIDLNTAAVEANRKAGKANTEVTAEQAARIKEVADASEAAAKKLTDAKSPMLEFGRAARETNKNLQTVAVEGLQHLEDAMIDVIMQAKSVQEAFKAMTEAILKDLLRLAIRMLITGPIATSLGGLISPRAVGGPVTAGKPYLVGEDGPEIFTPDASGKIMPDRAVGRSMGGAFNLQIINNGARVEAGQPEQKPDGSTSLVVIVDRITAKNGSTPGSATSRMLRAHGANQPIARRA